MKNKLTKAIAILVIFTLTFTYMTILAECTTEVYAASKELLAQNEKTNHSNVQFNSHLENGNHETEYYIGEDNKLYLSVKVTEGYLKNAMVEFENASFAIQADKIESAYVQEAKDGKVLFNEIPEGSQIEVVIPIAITNQDTVAMDHFSKETKTKFTATYVNNDGKEKAIEKEVLNQINWKVRNLEAQATQTITKYVPYNIENKKGVVLQTSIHTGIAENKTAISHTQIEVQTPKLAGQTPTRVIVTAENTLATNGSKTGIEFGPENYTYNAEEGTLQIHVTNKENEIAWLKAQDVYTVTMVYETENAYNQLGTATEVTIGGTVSVTPYNQEAIEKDISGKVTLTEQVGEFVNAILENQAEVSKAYIYANYNKAENKLETPYHITYKIGSQDISLVDSLQVDITSTTFIQKQEEEMVQNVGNLSTIKTIYVDKTMFQTYLGEEGKIEIYQNGQLVGTIAKPELQEGETQPDQYSFDCATLEATEGLTLKTSKLQKEGNLYIEVEKAIKSEINIDKETIKQINQIQETIQVTNYKEQTTETEETTQTTSLSGTKQTITGTTNLTEITSKAELQVSTQNLSTVVTNQNIELKAILEADTLDDALYTNPILKIAMPSQVENVEIQSAEILFTNELHNLNVAYNAQTKTIDLSLEGIQTEYNLGAMIKGPTIRIVANITTQKLIPSSEETITMQVYNYEDGTTQEVAQPISIIAPTGLVTINEIAGYSEQESTVQSVTGSENVGTLDIYAPAKTATIKGTIINNLQADATDVQILGRVPFEGNKTIDTNQDLGTNLTTNMTSGIQVNGIDAVVYYSANAEATKDLQDTNNQWTTQLQNLGDVKSYLIVPTQDQVQKATTLDFTYQVTVPENLPHNKDAYTTYKAYYTSETEVGTMAESVEAPVVGVSTKEGPELIGNLTATVAQGEKVHGEEYVRFFVEVRNTGSVDAKNVQIKVTNPEGTTFVTYDGNDASFVFDFSEDQGKTGKDTIHEKILQVGNIKAGESKTVEYELKIQNHIKVEIKKEFNEEAGKEIEVHYTYPEYDLENTVTIVADELETGITIAPYTLKKVPGKLSIVNATRIEEQDTKIVGDIVEARYTIHNVSDADATNTIFSYTIPNGIKIEEAYRIQNFETLEKVTDGFVNSNGKIEVNLGTLAIANKVEIVLHLKVEEIQNEKISTQATIRADEIEEHNSNIRYIYLAKTEVAVKQMEPEDRYIKEGKVFDLTFEITNKGKADISHLNIQCEVSDLIKPVNDTKQDGKILKYVDYIPAGGTSRVTIPVRVDLEKETDDGVEVSSKGRIIVNGTQIAETNTVKYVIEYVKSAHDNYTGPEEDNPGEDGTYGISGYVWLDSNVNGQRDEEEETIGNVQVLLLNKADNSIVKDQTTGQEKIFTTDVTGRYTFTNLKPGEYLVAFLYDSANYEVTVYQKEGVPASSNSDGIEMNINYNGEKRRGAVTNTIMVTTNNIRDIDLGLITAQSFDLKLDKYITKVTRVNSAENKTYTYDNAHIAKIDTLRKRLNESNIIVEYKLMITNEGAIPGYAKKIVDYLPQDLKFNSELNTDWYVGNDGNIYSNKLANEEIHPGESKEITLVLTKQMTETNLGNSRNTAEIYETYNVLGKVDIDSTPGNKAQNEDDISSADLVLSIVTGKIASYTGIVIASIAIIAFGAYEVKKHVLDKIAKI